MELENIESMRLGLQQEFLKKTTDPDNPYKPKLDILINCAGVVFSGDLESTFPQDHDY